MKKLLSLLLVFAMIFAFAACAEEEDDPADVTTTEEEEENPFEEFFEITWLVQLNADYREGRWDEVELEELFNVDLQVWPVDGRNTEDMAALMAAGEVPNYFFAPGVPRHPDGLYEEGLIRSVPFSMVREHLPGYWELCEQLPMAFEYNLVPGKTDEWLGFTHIHIGGCQYFYDATAVNLDWLEAVGYGFDEDELVQVKMTVEGYEKYEDNIFFAEGNFSFEDFNEILRAFTEDDPNNTGADDTYGMLYLPETAWTNFTQEGLFGFVHHGSYRYKDPVTGDVVPKWAYTPYRDYLQWVSNSLERGWMRRLPGEAGWYDEYKGVTTTGAMGVIQINGGGYLLMNSDVYRVLPPQNILLETDDTARFVIGPMFRGPEGKLVNMTYNIDPFGIGRWRVQMIGYDVSDEKLERIMAILQYTTFYDEDTYLRFQYGIEGIHWRWDGEPYISRRIATPRDQLPEEYQGQTRVFGMWVFPSTIDNQIKNVVEFGAWAYMPFMHYHGLWEKYTLHPEKFVSPVYMGYELHRQRQEMWSELSGEINPIISEFKNRALQGEIANFRDEWVDYIDRLYAAGLEQLINDFYNNPDFPQYDPGEKMTLR